MDLSWKQLYRLDGLVSIGKLNFLIMAISITVSHDLGGDQKKQNYLLIWFLLRDRFIKFGSDCIREYSKLPTLRWFNLLNIYNGIA